MPFENIFIIIVVYVNCRNLETRKIEEYAKHQYYRLIPSIIIALLLNFLVQIILLGFLSWKGVGEGEVEKAKNRKKKGGGEQEKKGEIHCGFTKSPGSIQQCDVGGPGYI